MSQPGKVVAIDPGISIGLAIRVAGKYLTATLDTPNDLDGLVAGADVIIIEKFVIFGGRRTGRISKYGLRTTEIVGYVAALARINKAKYIEHQPVNRMAFIKPAKRLVTAGATIHEVDALAHLLAWEARNANTR